MAEYISFASLVLAFGSFCVAIMAYRKSAKTQDKNLELQQKIVQIEEGRDQVALNMARSATLRAELQVSGRNSYRLCIVNDGSSMARNVHVELGGMPLVDHPVLPRGVEMPKLIGPKSEITCPIAIHMNCAPPFALRVFWDDDCGVNHTFKTTLTLS